MKTVARKYHLFLCLSLSAGLSGQRISSPAVVVVALCESGHKSHKSLRSFTNKAPLQLRSTSETARQKDATDLFFNLPSGPRKLSYLWVDFDPNRPLGELVVGLWVW